MITTVLFDLDGTLLPMDNDAFVKYYFGFLCKKMAPYGYEPEKLIDGVWAGTGAMVKNDGSRTNEEVFWEKFASIFGEQVREHEPVFYDFYKNEFNNAKEICGYDQGLVDLVHDLKERGLRVVLATNPIFPAIATENRMGWAGFAPEDFELYTTYENIGFSKPNPEYYMEITRRLGVNPSECIMVGNDVTEDLIASKIGMQVFLLTNNVINRENADYSAYPHGDTKALVEFMAKL